jgi:ornithine--oxo-acid transaminase
VENAERIGNALPTGLAGLKEKYDLIADVRGRGLIIGIEFGCPSGMRARAGWAMPQKAREGYSRRWSSSRSSSGTGC